MSFNGTYALDTSENLEPFLKGIGVKDEMVAKIVSIKDKTVTLTLSGDTLEIVSKGNQTNTNTLTLNAPSTFTFVTGFEIEVTMTITGNVAKGALKRGERTGEITMEVSDTGLVETFAIGGHTCKRIYKRT